MDLNRILMSDYSIGEKKSFDFMMEMPCGLAMFLSSGEIAFANSQARTILGISAGDNHGLALVHHNRQVIDTNGSVLGDTEDPVAIAFFTNEPTTGRLLGIRGPGAAVVYISLCATPRIEEAGIVSAVYISFSLVPARQLRDRTAVSEDTGREPLHHNSNVGLWKWNFRSKRFDHDNNFSRVTKLGRISSIEEWSNFVMREDRLKFLLQFDLLEAGVPEVEFAYKAARGGGSLQLYFVRGTTTSTSLDKEAVIEGSVVDISSLLPGTLEVGELVDSMTDGYVALDRNWLITFINKRAERLLRVSSTDVIGTGIWDQFPTGVGSEIDKQLQIAMSGKHVTFDFYTEGPRAWFEIRAHPIPNGVAVYFRDITERHNAAEERERLLSLSEEAKERLSYAASHDALTNLPNRTALLEWVDEALERLPRSQLLAIMFIDLDHFKRVNDTHGHAEGDRVLTQISNVLKDVIDSTSTVARLGGDEFVIATQVSSPSEAANSANRMLTELTKPVKVGSRSLVVTASVGIAISDSSSSADTLLRDADVALYAAKEEGRNRVRLFDSAIRQRVVTRLDTEADLRDALRLDQISIHFQPIFGALNQELVGFETLTRWFHQDKGTIPPEIFISVAEESGLILPLGEHLIDSAIEMLPELIKRSETDKAFTIWINVSSKQLEDFSFVNHLITSYQEKCKPGQLGIELTESVLSKDSSEIHSILHALDGRGIKIAIDDFGRGYSSLSRLVDYPVDLINLDRSLVEETSTTTGSGSGLLPALINLAHAINAKVCASGIETKEQLDSLLSLGVDMVSGYYLGRPKPLESLAESIALGRLHLQRSKEEH